MPLIAKAVIVSLYKQKFNLAQILKYQFSYHNNNIKHYYFRPVGVPHLEKVTLYNIDSNRSIDMTSISGSTVHFHSSFFQDKVWDIFCCKLICL